MALFSATKLKGLAGGNMGRSSEASGVRKRNQRPFLGSAYFDT